MTVFERPECDATAVPIPKIRVGYNYPWAWEKEGVYFGGGNPPGSNATMGKWVDTLRENLVKLKQDTKMDLVRIFLMGNMANFGSVVSTGAPGTIAWTLTLPPSLHPNFLAELTDMLSAFRDAKMQVIPSLLNYEAVLKLATLGDGCTGRYEIVTDAVKQNAFFEMVLEPMLKASVPFKEQIFAWEIINEPYWASSYPFHYKSHLGQESLSTSDVASFLSNALRRIAAHGVFDSTVGHRWVSDLSGFPTGTIRQFHWYPTTLGRQTFGVAGDGYLPDHSGTNAIIGEFPAGPPSDTDHIWWPDIIPDEGRSSVEMRVWRRLLHIEANGYRVALIWPDRTDPHGGTEWAHDTLKLSPEACRGVKNYLT
jgi:hypothetical protein